MARPSSPRRHPRSLLNLPLVEQAFRDPCVRYVCRGVDARWTYRGEIQTSLSGFNPMAGAVFYRAHSHVEPWLKDREADTRKYNYGDELIGEVMFLVHDYLHIWSSQWIQALCPELGFGTAPITQANLEKLTFCHLLTEAVATVGLDYWFLCTFNLNRRLDLGTSFSYLTASYAQENEEEYRKFFPKFTAQRRGYLGELTRFYCTGEFLGFGKQDLARSPLLLKWLSHELEYGESQRQYSRQWLAYLSPEKIELPAARLGMRVSMSERWQKQLVGQLSELLWSKVKEDRLETPPQCVDPARAWRASLRKPCDFRFLNWNALRSRPDLAKLDLNLGSEENFRHWFRQFLSQFDFAKLDPELLAIKSDLFGKRRRDLCSYFFRRQAKLRAHPREPLDLFLLN